eukprot:2604054-Amphidinium_carterae.2
MAIVIWWYQWCGVLVNFASIKPRCDKLVSDIALMSRFSARVTLADFFLDASEPNYGFWLEQANHERSERDKVSGRVKWKDQHKQAFEEKSLEWPPVYRESFRSMVKEARMTEREAEILHYVERCEPVSECIAEEWLVDVSQSLGRSRQSNRQVPCITPGSRLWCRARERWLLAPEAVRCQGYAVPQGLEEYSHRQIIDLVGNAFHADSAMVSFAVALASCSFE